MCDYCDCRSHPQIAALSADHAVLSGLLAGLGRAADRDDAAGASMLIGRLHDLLDGHARREELGVFTELRRADVDGGYVDRFERDHDRVQHLVSQAERSDWRRAALQLVVVLGDHILREESDLFPSAHQLLAPDQWDAVDRAVEAVATPVASPTATTAAALTGA